MRASVGPESPAFEQRRAAFERVAFGLTDIDERPLPAFPSGEAAIRSLPVWDAAHVASAVNAPATGVTLRAREVGRGRSVRLAVKHV